MHLVLIETTGNQAYIFATNKLRECIGASELTVQVGTRFVLEAVAEVGEQMPPNLRDPATFPAILAGNPIEVILSVSGKALLLVRDAETGRSIVREVTRRALRDAPGLEVRGVVSRDFDFAHDALHPLIGEVHRQFETVRSQLPGPSIRFQRLPIIAECASSGLPAARMATEKDQLASDERREYAAQTFAKLSGRARWEERRNEILRRYNASVTLPGATTDLEELGCDWLAIVHADGNGLGQVFLNFDKRARTHDNRDYIEKLRKFSMALDECTEKAFCQAMTALRCRQNIVPIVPLVLGGDDLTVVCDGRQALQFTKKFIDCFEEETSQHPDVKRVVANGVTSCAGVAIVKPHFPFFAGYQLAEELLKEAKKLAKKNPDQFVSAIDFHMLYDASGADLERIRRELKVDHGATLLVGRPYVTTAEQGPVNRHWSDLMGRIAAVRATDEVEQRRQLPNSMLHDLREGLFLGCAPAEARLRLVRERYRPHIDPVLVGDKLFWLDGQQYITGLLDAIDTAEFWEGQP